MTVRAGTHIRSLRMSGEMAAAVRRASQRAGVTETGFIVAAVGRALEAMAADEFTAEEFGDELEILDPFASEDLVGL